jgi:aldose 1-epimerase
MRTNRKNWRTARMTARVGAGAVLVAALTALGVVAATRAPAATGAAKGAALTAAPAHHGHLSISKEFFGNAVEPYTGLSTPTYRYTLTNDRGMKIQLLSYGAITQSIVVPDRWGHKADVVLGFKTLNEYVTEASPPVTSNGGPYFGETIGRYGNRIANGKFTLNQPGVGPVTYTVPQNNGVNSLHGGLYGFGNHIWTQVGDLIHTRNEVGVTLELVSPNGDESHPAGSPGCPTGCTGYPAQITVDVTFTLNNDGQYKIHYHVVNDSANLNTVVNLTNHSYFNLAGEASGPAVNQLIQINADSYTPTDSGLIPLGTLNPVAGTPFDFRHFTALGDNINNCSTDAFSCNQLLTAHGLDHNWVLNSQTPDTTGPDGLNLAARALDPASGRMLTVWTDQPGVQFYASNYLVGTLVGISGHTYRQTQAYTFETQHFPDSPNEPSFPSTELAAGQTLDTTTIFAFSTHGET